MRGSPGGMLLELRKRSQSSTVHKVYSKKSWFRFLKSGNLDKDSSTNTFLANDLGNTIREVSADRVQATALLPQRGEGAAVLILVSPWVKTAPTVLPGDKDLVTSHGLWEPSGKESLVLVLEISYRPERPGEKSQMMSATVWIRDLQRSRTNRTHRGDIGEDLV